VLGYGNVVLRQDGRNSSCMPIRATDGKGMWYVDGREVWVYLLGAGTRGALRGGTWSDSSGDDGMKCLFLSRNGARGGFRGSWWGVDGEVSDGDGGRNSSHKQSPQAAGHAH
jgi:hypothetical protein